MKETTFINQNKDKWYKFERMYQQNRSDPDELTQLFIELTDDLSYARTHYPKRSVRVYLNGLAQKVFHQMYKTRKVPLSKFASFWSTDLPLEMYRSRKSMLTSLIVFAVSVLIGVVSTMNDHEFFRVIVGDEYVDQTLRWIREGRAMSVYGTSGEAATFVSITSNNLQVAFTCFIFGILASVGTGFFMVNNGIMLGAFQSFFYYQGVLITSALSIWIHGTFEISAIIIAGGAGFTLGRGILFPGTYSRVSSLIVHAKRGMKIMIGIVPVIIIAGFLEGYVTRHGMDMPVYASLGIILVSLVIMVVYFGIYPFVVAKRLNYDVSQRDKTYELPAQKLEFYKIRTVVEVFSDTFSYYRQYFKYFGKLIYLLVPAVIGYSMLRYWSLPYANSHLEWFEQAGVSFNVMGRAHWDMIPVFLTIVSLNLTAVFHSFVCVKKELAGEEIKYWSSLWIFMAKHIWTTLAVVFMIWAMSFYVYWQFQVILVFGVPFILHLAFPSMYEGKNFFSGLGRGFMVAGSSWITTVSIYAALVLLGFAAQYAMTTLFGFITGDMLGWFIVTETDSFMFIFNVVDSAMYMIVLMFILPMFAIALGLIYFSTMEKEQAIGMFGQLDKFGKRSRVYESQSEGEY